MTLEDLANIAEVIGLGAILISLVAIYIQQRKDHAFAQAESEREILQQVAHWFDDLLAHPEGLENIQSCLQSYHGATARAQAEFTQFILKAIIIAEQAVFMNSKNLVDDDSYMKLVMLPIMHLAMPGGREYWEHSKAAYGKKIVATIDEILEKSPPTVDEYYQVFPYFRPAAPAGTETADKTTNNIEQTDIV